MIQFQEIHSNIFGTSLTYIRICEDIIVFYTHNTILRQNEIALWRVKGQYIER